MPDYRNDPTLPAPGFPGSHLVVDGAYVFVSGMTAADLPGGAAVIGDVGEETRRVMHALARLLAGVESDLAEVVRADVHLADLNEIAALDAAYAEFFAPSRYPARTCTESPRLAGGCRVEITLMARRRGHPA